MKKQDILAVAVLAIILSMLGVFVVDAYMSTPEENYSLTDPPEPVQPGFSEEGLEYMRDGNLRSFNISVDGVDAPKNETPFGD